MRPLIWCLVLAALALFLLQWWLDSPPARRMARLEIEEWLTAALERQVSLDDVGFELLPFSIELHGFEIAGAEPEDPPFLRLPYAYAEADLDALRHRRLHLRYVRLERPEVDLRFFPGGGDNLVGRGLESDGADFELWIDHVEITRGSLGLDHERVPLSLEARTLRSRLRGLGDRRLEGRLVARDVLVELPEARPIRVSVVAEGGLEHGRMWVEKGEVHGAGIEADFHGECGWQQRADRKCHFTTRGTAHGRTLAALGYFDSLTGRFAFDGGLGWRPGSVGWRGRVEAAALRLWQRRLTDVAGELSADRFGVLLALERARYSGGRLAGDINVAIHQVGRPLTVALAFEDMELDRLLADQSIPVEGLAARVHGEAVYQCPLRRCRHGDGRAEVSLVRDPEAAGLEVAGQFPLRIERGVIIAEAADVVADRQSLLTTGWYRLPNRSGRFDYQIDTADIGELVPMLPLEQLPSYFPTAGRGHLQGIFYLEEGRAWSSVQLGLSDVATASTPPVARVEGGFDVSPWAVENLRLLVRDPPSGAAAGEATLDIAGRLPFEGIAALEFDAVRVPMELVRPWFDLPVLLEGQVTGRLEARLGEDVRNGRLLAILTSARVAGLPVDGLQADMAWRGGSMHFDQLSLQSEAGTLEAVGDLDWSTGALDFVLHSDRLELGGAPLAAFLPRDDLSGHLVVDGRLRGRLDAPDLTLAARAERLGLGGRPIEAADTRLDIRWNNHVLQIGAFLGGVAELRGGGRLDRRRADLGFTVEAEDLAAVAELFGPLPVAAEGQFSGRLQLSGPLDSPRARLLVEQLELELDHRHLSSEGTTVVHFDSAGWRVDGLQLVEELTASELAIDGAGSWQGIRDGSMDLSLRASLDADWLTFVLPELEVGGRLRLDTRVAGSLEQPRIHGVGRLTGGRLVVPGLAESFTDLHGLMRFDGDQARIEDVRGDFAGGAASLSGVVGLGDQVDYRLELSGRGLRLPYLAGWALEGDVDLAMRSTDEGHLLTGTARMQRLEFLEDIRFDLASLVRDALRGQRLLVEPAGGFRSSVQLEVQVLAEDAVRLRNNLADLRGDADFVLRGNLAQPVLFGEIEMKPGGRLEYNDSEYQLKRGRLIFSDPFRLTPEVDLVASTRVRDIDITLSLTGPFERLEARFASEPPLPDVEVFRLLAGGEAYLDEGTDLVAERTAQLGEDRGTSAATFLYGQAASVIGQRVNSLFRFDRFRIDPLTGSADNLSKARVTVGKRLSKDFFVTYSVDPSSTDNQRMQVEWQVAAGLVLVLTANGDDSFSADARWDTSF